MGIENMRRWPVYLMFAVCILLVLSLLNSGSMLTVLRNKVGEVSLQLQECSEQKSKCVQETMQLLEQKGSYISKIEYYDQLRTRLLSDAKENKQKIADADSKVNETLIDMQMCKTELASLKNLQLSKSGVIETLRLEKETLTTQLADRKNKIDALEKEVERLKAALTTKSTANVAVSSKVTPAAQPAKLSSALNAHEPLNEPILDNDAKEDIDDTNALNDGQDFDPQL